LPGRRYAVENEPATGQDLNALAQTEAVKPANGLNWRLVALAVNLVAWLVILVVIAIARGWLR
jgi:hypothetical protein